MRQMKLTDFDKRQTSLSDFNQTPSAEARCGINLGPQGGYEYEW